MSSSASPTCHSPNEKFNLCTLVNDWHPFSRQYAVAVLNGPTANLFPKLVTWLLILSQESVELKQKMMAYMTLVATDELNVPASGLMFGFDRHEHNDAPTPAAMQLVAAVIGNEITAPIRRTEGYLIGKNIIIDNQPFYHGVAI